MSRRTNNNFFCAFLPSVLTPSRPSLHRPSTFPLTFHFAIALLPLGVAVVAVGEGEGEDTEGLFRHVFCDLTRPRVFLQILPPIHPSNQPTIAQPVLAVST